MPIYEFECNKCKWKFEILFLKYFKNTTGYKCPICNSIANKIISRSSFRSTNDTDKAKSKHRSS